MYIYIYIYILFIYKIVYNFIVGKIVARIRCHLWWRAEGEWGTVRHPGSHLSRACALAAPRRTLRRSQRNNSQCESKWRAWRRSAGARCAFRPRSRFSERDARDNAIHVTRSDIRDHEIEGLVAHFSTQCANTSTGYIRATSSSPVRADTKHPSCLSLSDDRRTGWHRAPNFPAANRKCQVSFIIYRADGFGEFAEFEFATFEQLRRVLRHGVTYLR